MLSITLQLMKVTMLAETSSFSFIFKSIDIPWQSQGPFNVGVSRFSPVYPCIFLFLCNCSYFERKKTWYQNRELLKYFVCSNFIIWFNTTKSKSQFSNWISKHVKLKIRENFVHCHQSFQIQPGNSSCRQELRNLLLLLNI